MASNKIKAIGQRADSIFSYCDLIRERFKSFSLGNDPRAEDIKARIDELRDGDQWSPPALLQISPDYEKTSTIAELAAGDALHATWKGVSKLSHRLYQHQREAIDAASRWENFVITAGTGSGKSLCYIVPIVDRLFAARKANSRQGTKAIICYPMNALVNSQLKELEKFELNKHGISFARYTGQENQSARQEIGANPPDILLTNFMMLEYLLTRNHEDEQPILAALRDCEYLVLDELHTYRGRQGADVAMLIRRLRLLVGREFLCIGTSATMTSDEGDDANSNELVAKFATRLFGSAVDSKNIISETLARKTNPEKSGESVIPHLKAEIVQGVDKLLASEDTFRNSAASVWSEFKFGVDDSTPRLKRKLPQTLQDAIQDLSANSGLPIEDCGSFLRKFLTDAARKEWFAIRMHQFFSGPGQFLCTIKDKAGSRHFSILGEKENEHGDPYFATHFCRNCSQEYHPVATREAESGLKFLHRHIDDAGSERDRDILDFGFITPVIDGMKWSASDENDRQNLPDEWLRESRSGEIKLKSEKKNLQPRVMHLNTKGVEQKEASEGTPYIFLPGKFRFCPACGDVHTSFGRDSIYLSSLNAEGRCSATTTLLISLLNHEPKFNGESDAKTLAFCDNRQDAALQAGYFNDFIFNLKLRAGLLKALQDNGSKLRHHNIAGCVQAALGFTQLEVTHNLNRRREFLANPGNTDQDNIEKMRGLLLDVIGYHLIFDLRRGWRHSNPNLERLELIRIDFEGVEKLDDLARWVKAPQFIRELAGSKRLELANIVLKHMLEEKCVNSRYMSEKAKEAIPNRARDNLAPAWQIEHDTFEMARMLTTGTQRSRQFYFARSGPTSRLGKKIRPQSQWEAGKPGMLSTADYAGIVKCALETLQSANLIVAKSRSSAGEPTGWQVNCDCLIWTLQPSSEIHESDYYAQLYTNVAQMLSDETAREDLATMEGQEHTAQVSRQDREEYEKRFRGDEGRKDRLPVLVCSPTMELGIDISDLNTVYLRNVPPTPANYVQRSGRAGRAGRPAMVITYCSAFSPHDQYYFNKKRDMVAGKIHAPNIELANRDLLESHFNALWLQKTGVGFPRPVAEIMEYADEANNLPIKEDFKAGLRNETILADVRKDVFKLISDMRAMGFIPEYAERWLKPDYDLPDIYESLERALDRWRNLFMTVRKQMEDMSKRARDLSLSELERDQANRMLRAAIGQERTLRTETERDFYSYRFLACQGFLPGYNFPRLPLVAFLQRGGNKSDQIARPRFLALSEFGPRSFIYHQGDRYCVGRATLSMYDRGESSSDIATEEMTICRNCGYCYRHQSELPDLCESCRANLSEKGEVLQKLYSIDNFSAYKKDRINAGEEERQRLGFDIKTHYRFHGATKDRISGMADISGNTIRLDYGHAADVWRMNLGWRRRRKNGDGFYINPVTGEWKKTEEEVAAGRNTRDRDDPYSVRIIPYVQDTRNILIVRWDKPLQPFTTATLRHALKMGMIDVFQIEENELAAEPLPDREDEQQPKICNAFLFYESAEGGAGVLSRLTAEKDQLSKIACAALRRMHFVHNSFRGLDVDGLLKSESEDACKSGCYRCLLSYYNQQDHLKIDRRDPAALAILLNLANSEVAMQSAHPQADEAGLPQQPAASSASSNGWLEAADEHGWKRPDEGVRRLQGNIAADYYYSDLQAAIFIGDTMAQADKDKLEEKGIHCVVFSPDRKEWPEQFELPVHKRLFGKSQ